MSRRIRRFVAAEDGASLVEYSLAVVLIGLAAVVVTSFVGQATSDAFDEVGSAFPEPSATVALGDPAVAVGFDDVLDAVDDITGLGKSLINKVEAAETSYLAGDVGGASGHLDSLIAQVDAQEGKKITSQEAAAIRTAVGGLVATMGSG